MKLWLDDIRPAPDESWHREYCFEGAAWTTSGLHSYGKKLESVSFDHDLGINRETGMDFAKWLISFDQKHPVLSDDFVFHVHSANPCGAENIKSLMNCYLKNRATSSDQL